MNFDEICNEHFDKQKKRFRKLKQICQFYHFCERNSSCLLKFCFKKMKTKNFKSFMRTIIAKKFKIWLLWTLNAYFDMKIVFSLNNYWRISKMMMFIVVDRKLKKKFAKNINNVHYISSLFTSIRSNWFVRFVCYRNRFVKKRKLCQISMFK